MNDMRMGSSPEVVDLWRQFISFMGEERRGKSLSSLKGNHGYVLILEDNIGYNGSLNDSEVLESISKFLSSNKKIEMFHLSYIHTFNLY